ncbi:hypothetical protein ABZY05_33500 [Streptomyces canus]|uniref:hypothetical protein n=1 Tax=Streptomyces canus TaxID=58343 RepID=UPI0033BE8A3F
MSPLSADSQRHLVPSPMSPLKGVLVVAATEDGICWDRQWQPYGDFPQDYSRPALVEALNCQSVANGWVANIAGSKMLPNMGTTIDDFGARVLTLPRSKRWREALSFALTGDWSAALVETGSLADTALGLLKAEARAVHRQLVPLWQRRTRHGRVLSLDADLGGLSLHDVIAADADQLARTTGGVFEDERLNRVLRGLNPDERATVYAYVEGEGITWAEAAATAGSADPDAFGERVRRKIKRLGAEQHRRAEQRRQGRGRHDRPSVASSPYGAH